MFGFFLQHRGLHREQLISGVLNPNMIQNQVKDIFIYAVSITPVGSEKQKVNSTATERLSLQSNLSWPELFTDPLPLLSHSLAIAERVESQDYSQAN